MPRISQQPPFDFPAEADSFLQSSPPSNFSPVGSPRLAGFLSRNAFPRLLLGEDDLFAQSPPENGASTMGHLQPPMTPLSPSAPSSSMIAKEQLAHHNFSRLPMTPPDPSDPESLDSTGDDVSSSVSSALHVISTERAALAHVEHLYQRSPLAQDHLARAVSQIASSIRNGGKLVCCGVGKSGKIAQKLEATMNSLGICSTFLHPTEALHGDLGMIRPPSDMGILLPAPVHEDEETSFGVSAPTSSTTVALSLGDALAIATARRLHSTTGRGPAEIFRSFHPGGAIGAASNVTTPMSMSTASFPSSNSDDQQLSISSFPRQNLVTQGPRIADVLVPIDQIPTVFATGKVRLLNILLTAIQHPSAKSWVHLSPVEIIPPRHLRSLSQSSYVDMDVTTFTSLGLPFAVSRDDWQRVPYSSTIEDVRQLVTKTTTRTGFPVTVIAVMKDENPDDCVGVLEAEDLWDDRT
ncbi:hypothetical protein EYZ11_003029 [Aspergillus tanneri]|uniref:SIS domain-containing protein n=1 Tax=Aspergillus tanneri TaxID=1220188 RepID=A0A4S3JPH9_9EURO|nr:hypothetical protein EYZ11_003029 [Aspergillus tanneri]